MAEGDYNVKAIISAETSKFEKGMKTAQKSLDGVTKSINDVSHLLKTAFSVAGVTLATKTVVDFGKKCVNAATDASKQFNILENTINATGASAWTSIDKLDGMAKKLAKSTNFSVTETEKMQSVLLGFRNITDDTFEEASEAIMDMATVMGMDLTSAVQTVGKALDDPIKGLDSLRRQGFAFTEEQKQQLKVLIMNDDQLKAQKIILDELSSSYGGAAKSAQTGFALIQHTMDDLQETIGNKLMPVVDLMTKNSAKSLSKIIDILNSSNFDTFITIMINLSKKVKEVFSNIQDYISNVFTEIKGLITSVNFSPFIEKLEMVVTVIKNIVNVIKERIESITESFKNLFSNLSGSFSSFNFDEISEFINKIIEGFWFLYEQANELWTELTSFIFSKIKQIWEVIKNIFNNSQEALSQSESDIKSWGDFIWDNLDRIFKIAQDLINGVKAILKGDWSTAWEYAKLTVLRVADGILTIISTIANAFPGLINKMAEGLNWLIDKINVVRRFLQMDELSLIGQFESVDLSKSSGLDKLISDTENKIEQLSGKAADVSIRTLNKIETQSKGTFSKIASEINDLTIKTEKTINKTQKTFSKSNSQIKKEYLNLFAGLKEGWTNFKLELEKDANDWTDVISSSYKAMTGASNQMFEMLGENLTGAGNSYEDFGAVALDALAQVLEALAAQLSATAALRAANYDFASAAVAAAGAAAALVAAGAIKGIANSMKKTSDSTKSATEALKELKETIDNISKSGASGRIADVTSAYAQSVNAVKEAQTALSQKATSETYDVYTKSLSSYTKAVNSLDESLKELNDTLDLQAKAFREIYSATDKVSKNIVKNKVLSDLKTQLDSAYSDIENIGKTIGETMFNGIAEGATTSTFLTDVKKYIINAMTKIAVFTESFQKQLADATSGMLVGITTGDDSIIENSTKAIKNLYETALSTANAIEGSITGIFNNIDTKTNATVRSLKETLEDINKTGYTDLSTTLKFNAKITKDLSSAYDKMKEAEKNYYSENVKATEERKKSIEKEISDLELKIGGMFGWQSNLYVAENDLQRYKDYLTNIAYPYIPNIDWKWVEETFPEYQELLNKVKYYTSLVEEGQRKISDLKQEYANVNVISTEALKNLNDATNTYNEALSKLNSSMSTLSSNLKTQNKELDTQIQLYKELYTSTDASFNSAVLETSLNKIKSAFYSFFEDLQDMGLTVGENLVNAIADGMSQADFLTSMKDHIRKAIIQTVVYTETLQHEIAQIGATISKGIAEGFTDTGLHEIKRDLSYIFYMAQNSISKIDTVLDNVFSGYATGTQNATRGLHLVGEAGPELVRFRGGEQVINAGNTQKVLSDTGRTNNFNVTFNNLQDTSAFAMMQQLKRYNREMAINGIF